MAPEPRASASVIPLRDGAVGLEVLLARRNPRARFMGGAWVFPGGALDPGEEHRAGAAREAREEVGLDLDPAGLVPFSRWITPPQLAIRFDTHFFLAAVPSTAEARADGGEMVDVAWWGIPAALEAHVRGALDLPYPTMKQLEELAGFADVGAVLAWARGREIVTVAPQLPPDPPAGGQRLQSG